MKNQIAIAFGLFTLSANVAGLCLAAVEFDSSARISGVTDKDPLTYAPGEKMTFTLKLADLGRGAPLQERRCETEVDQLGPGLDPRLRAAEALAGAS